MKITNYVLSGQGFEPEPFQEFKLEFLTEPFENYANQVVKELNDSEYLTVKNVVKTDTMLRVTCDDSRNGFTYVCTEKVVSNEDIKRLMV
ncbi:hypothetical protein [Bacillus mycoides]|uniref:hypothetical protein n=1 Tax=Bacillus mycoides TaxID=1405 RepID=UPI003A80D1C8